MKVTKKIKEIDLEIPNGLIVLLPNKIKVYANILILFFGISMVYILTQYGSWEGLQQNPTIVLLGLSILFFITICLPVYHLTNRKKIILVREKVVIVKLVNDSSKEIATDSLINWQVKNPHDFFDFGKHLYLIFEDKKIHIGGSDYQYLDLAILFLEKNFSNLRIE